MSLFKKFTDFCAGIAAFVGGLFLLQKYMAFEPLELEEYLEWLKYQVKYTDMVVTEEITEAPSKLSQFFTPEHINGYDYRILAILVLSLIFSVLIGRIFKKLPHLCFFVSLIPIVITTHAFTQKLLFVQIGLFFAVCALHTAGNVAECIFKDKEDGRHRLWICAKISLLFPAALCLFCTKIAEKIPTENINEKLDIFGELAFKMIKPENMQAITKIGWMYLIIFAISVLLYNVYFIDTVLTTIPLGYLIYLLHGEFLTFEPAVFTVLAGVCFMTHIALVTCENNLSRKEQLKLRAEQAKASEANETTA